MIRRAIWMLALSLCVVSLPASRPAAAQEAAPGDQAAQIRDLIEKMAPQDWAGQHYEKELVRIGRPAIPYLREAIKDHPVPRVRYWSLTALAEIDPEEALPVLMEHIKDEHLGVRATATYYLGRWFDRDEVRKAILERLDDEEPMVQRAACRVIWEKHYTDAKTKLLKMLGNDWSPVRCNALETLARLDGEKSVELLQRVLADDPGPAVRALAVTLLAEWFQREDVQKSILAALADEKYEVQDAACRIILDNEWTAALPRLKELVTDGTDDQRYNALDTVAQMEGAGAIELLQQALRRDSSPDVRAAAADYLADYLDHEGVPASVVGAMGDRSEQVRSLAYERITDKESPENFQACRAAVLAALDENNDILRGWALRLVQERRMEEALPKLREFLTSENEVLRYGAFVALPDFEGDTMIPALKKALAEDTSGQVRAAAVYGLGRWFDRPDVQQVVLQTLDDKDPYVQGWAMRIVVEKRHLDALSKIMTIFNGNEEAGRYNAMTAIAELKGADALPILQDVFQNDRSAKMREGALRACTLIRPPMPRIAELFIGGLSDDDESVRAAAAELLRKGFDQDFGFAADRTAGERQQAVQRWEAWYKEVKDKLAWDAESRKFVVAP